MLRGCGGITNSSFVILLILAVPHTSVKGLIRLMRAIREGFACSASTNHLEVGMVEKCYW